MQRQIDISKVVEILQVIDGKLEFRVRPRPNDLDGDF
jgi:hypothetical protein